MSTNEIFRVGDKVVYSSYGVGEIKSIEEQKITADYNVMVYVIAFTKNRMTLTIPFSKANNLRSLMDKHFIEDVYKILSTKPKNLLRIGNRKSQNLEDKLKSGNLFLAAEVLRDLYKRHRNKEKSYSERVLYESALNKVATEIAAIENSDETIITQRIFNVLDKT